MNTAYLSLGSNEGDRLQWLRKALSMLNTGCGTVTKRSSVYETAAWGITDQPDFLNMAVEISTALLPEDLLSCILNIETQLGRQRSVKWGPRTLDIDILLYNNTTLAIPDLTIPHPYMQERRFTLLPLSEIAPDVLHPTYGQTIAELLRSCPDKLEVHKLTEI